MELDTLSLEEGELSSDSDSYTPLERPANYASTEDKRFNKTIEYESDLDPISSSETDSDSDNQYNRAKKPKKSKALLNKKAQSSNSRKVKKYDVWSTRAHEDVLSETLNCCEVSHIDRSRDVESYDYTLSHSYRENIAERTSNKRTRNDRNNTNIRLHKPKEEEKEVKPVPRYILDLTATESCTDEEFSVDVANKLFEEKEDLILKIVKIIGQAQAKRIFNEVKRIEADGGMMIMNQTRRRTPGGIFMFLLKHDTELTKEQRDKIFENDRVNYKEFKKMKKKQKYKEMRNQIAASGKVKLPDLLRRADLVQKLTKETWTPKESTDQEDVVNPPPTPETDGHISGDGLDVNEGQSAVSQNKLDPYEDDFLDLNSSHDMDLF